MIQYGSEQVSPSFQLIETRTHLANVALSWLRHRVKGNSTMLVCSLRSSIALSAQRGFFRAAQNRRRIPLAHPTLYLHLYFLLIRCHRFPQLPHLYTEAKKKKTNQPEPPLLLTTKREKKNIYMANVQKQTAEIQLSMIDCASASCTRIPLRRSSNLSVNLSKQK